MAIDSVAATARSAVVETASVQAPAPQAAPVRDESSLFAGMAVSRFISCSTAEGHRGRPGAKPNQGPGAAFSFSVFRTPDGVSSPATTYTPAWTDAYLRYEGIVNINASLVSVVDDDESVRESLPDLLRVFGFAARAFSSAEEFLASDCVEQTRCLILDIAMPGMTGPELQRELILRRQQIPIVFVTARRDDTVRSRLLKQGAVECLFKPFSDTALLEALNIALSLN